MEIGLGLSNRFLLETSNPIFINFCLTPEEAKRVRAELSPGFTLQKIRFCENDPEQQFWLSYNAYELVYPKKELQSIKKIRCEVNTFVTDEHGRAGIYVFAGSPFVSKERRFSILGHICDFAERLVQLVYGCGRLASLDYRLQDKLHFSLSTKFHSCVLEVSLSEGKSDRLSDDYHRFNDISFFNSGRSWDAVFVDSRYLRARFGSVCTGLPIVTTPFFERAPDVVYYHRGKLAYLVDAMNRGIP